jgi:hypothetical protein
MSYVQFKAHKLDLKESYANLDFVPLNFYRKMLVNRGVLGYCKLCDKGCGYGNISFRTKKGFVISCSKTGHLLQLSNKDVSLVKLFSIDENSVFYVGENVPSSESLMHGAFYENNPHVSIIIHIHSWGIWNKIKERQLGYFEWVTVKEGEAGSVELARSCSLIKCTGKVSKVFLLNHAPGLVYIGADFMEIMKEILFDLELYQCK